MGDRTSLTLVADLSAWPEHVKERLEEELGTPEWDSAAAWGWAEVNVGWVADRDLEGLIEEAFAEAGADLPAYDAWEEPKYDWLGTVVRYRPGLSPFYADCDTGGSVLVSEDVIKAGMERNGLNDFLARLVGPERLSQKIGV